MKIPAKIVLPLLAACLLSGQAYAEDHGVTARGMFARLPPSIFENTSASLEDGDKQQLLRTGASRDWEITGETPDMLVFSELPFRDRGVIIRLFRNEVDGSTEVATGTFGDPVCTMEMWRLDASGRILPVDLPGEPEISEFFSKKRKPSRKQQSTVLICLDYPGLYAKPLFWDGNRMREPRTDREIAYDWTGSGFAKKVATKRKIARK